MSETYEDCIQLFCVRCGNVGLNCNCTIYGISEDTVIDNTFIHMFENHAIAQEEMTADFNSLAVALLFHVTSLTTCNGLYPSSPGLVLMTGS